MTARDLDRRASGQRRSRRTTPAGARLRIDAHRPRDWRALRDRRDEHPHGRNAGKRRGIGRAHVVPWKKSDKTRM